MPRPDPSGPQPPPEGTTPDRDRLDVGKHEGGPERENGQSAPWSVLLKVLGALLASAAWVQLVGGVVLWIDQVDVTPTPAVALLPTELLFAVGIRSLILPLVGGLAAFGLLLLWERATRRMRINDWTPESIRDPLPDVAPGCERKKQPRGLKTVLLVVVCVTWIIAISRRDLTWSATAAIMVGAFIAAGLICVLVTEAGSFPVAGATLFATTAVFGGLVAFAMEAGQPAKLDLGVAVRNNGAAVGGFFLGRSDDQLYLITANPPAGRDTEASAALTGGALAVGTRSVNCWEIRIASGDCFVHQVTGIPTEELARFTIGARGVDVGPAGFRAATVLARRASLQRDEELPPEEPDGALAPAP